MVRQRDDAVGFDFRVPVREMLKLRVLVDTNTPPLFLVSLFTVQPGMWPRLCPLRGGSLPKSSRGAAPAESRKTAGLSVHADSQTERSFPLQFFQCHFKLQLPANRRAPCRLTSRASQFPPAAEPQFVFFFKTKMEAGFSP